MVAGILEEGEYLAIGLYMGEYCGKMRYGDDPTAVKPKIKSSTDQLST